MSGVRLFVSVCNDVPISLSLSRYLPQINDDNVRTGIGYFIETETTINYFVFRLSQFA